MIDVESPLAPHQQHDDICYIRASRRPGLRPQVIYEALRCQGEKLEVLDTTREVAERSGEAASVRDHLIRRLDREGWIPTQEPLVVGDDILAVYVRRR
jgi:hypothetical protein